jgi:hypothetical protein
MTRHGLQSTVVNHQYECARCWLLWKVTKTVFQTNQWRQNGELQRYFLRALRFISCSESKLLNYVSLKAFGMCYWRNLAPIASSQTRDKYIQPGVFLWRKAPERRSRSSLSEGCKPERKEWLKIQSETGGVSHTNAREKRSGTFFKRK